MLVDSKLKFSLHCDKLASSGNSILGMIKRTVKSRKKDVIVRLYKALVRPKLEYCVQAWCPYLKKDVEKLEKVQARALRLIKECREMNYEERLKVCGIVSLADRRVRGDMLEVFKILKGYTKIDYKIFFTYNNAVITRGNSLKLTKSHNKLDIRNNFFSQRIIYCWNSLPDDVVQSLSVISFKENYDRYLYKYKKKYIQNC